MNELASDNSKFTILETGIEFRDELSFDEWEHLGDRLTRIGKSIGFIIGDWINYGEKRYGSKYQEAIHRTGLDYQTLANFAYVARRVEFSCRQENLGFEHHAVVAKLKTLEERKEWLEIAKREKLSKRRLRVSINKGRVVSIDEMQGDPADRGQQTYMTWILRLSQWWRKRIEDEPVEHWDDLDRSRLKRDLKPLVEIYEQL